MISAKTLIPAVWHFFQLMGVLIEEKACLGLISRD